MDDQDIMGMHVEMNEPKSSLYIGILNQQMDCTHCNREQIVSYAKNETNGEIPHFRLCPPIVVIVKSKTQTPHIN